MKLDKAEANALAESKQNWQHKVAIALYSGIRPIQSSIWRQQQNGIAKSIDAFDVNICSTDTLFYFYKMG